MRKSFAIFSLFLVGVFLFPMAGHAIASEGAVQGTVTDASTGQPIMGAHVAASSSMFTDVYKVTETDSTGHYLLTGLSSGTVVVFAQKTGYTPANSPVQVNANDTVTADFSLVPITPPGQGSIMGTVTDASTGDPVPNAQVSVRRDDYHATWVTTTTDANGQYILNGVSEGSTLVVAEQAGYYPGHQIADVVANNTVTVDFALAPFVQPAKGTVEGTVTDAGNGNPIGGAIVYARASASNDFSAQNHDMHCDGNQYAITDSTGHYLLDNLCAGDYILVASKFGFVPASQGVSVVANTTTAVDFQLQSKESQEGSVQGTISDASTGDPIAGAFVFVSIDAENWYGGIPHLFAKTDSTGFYQLDHIPAGTRTIKAVKFGYNPNTVDVDILAMDTVTANITLAPRPPKARGTIEGTVSDTSTGMPLAGAKVFVREDVDDLSVGCKYGFANTTTDENGFYSLYSVSTGTRYVIAVDSGYHQSVQQVEVLADETTEADFMLEPFGESTATLIVKVIVATGNSAISSTPVSNATVFIPVNDEILPTSDWDDHATVSNSVGSALVTNIPTGTQLVAVTKDGFTSQIVSVNLVKGTNTITVQLSRSSVTAVTNWELYQ